MRRLKLQEILTCTAFDYDLFQKLRFRDQLALAFGRRSAYDSFSFIELDCVALLLCETLAKSYDRQTAARLVRVDGDIWGRAVGLAEAHPERPAHYCVVDFLRNGRHETEYLTAATNSTDLDEIARKLSMSPRNRASWWE